MKKLHYILLLAAIVFIASCAPYIYQLPDTPTIAAGHKKIAILPAKVVFTLSNDYNKTTPEQIKEMQKNNALAFQNSIYQFILNRKGQGNITIDVLDVSDINAILKRNNAMNDENELLVTNDEACKLLGVDGVISSNFNLNKPMNDGIAVAVVLLAGIWAPTNQAKASLSIIDCGGNKLIWKYDHTWNGSIGSSPQQLVDGMMSSASTYLPYNVKKKKR